MSLFPRTHGYQHHHLFYGLVCGKVEIACEVISTAINTILPSKYSKCVLVKSLTTAFLFTSILPIHSPKTLRNKIGRGHATEENADKGFPPGLGGSDLLIHRTGRVCRRPAGGAAERAASWKLLGPRALKQGVGSSVRPLRPLQPDTSHPLVPPVLTLPELGPRLQPHPSWSTSS